MEDIQKMISQLSTTYEERMRAFETELQRESSSSAPSSTSISTLATDFASFKSFVIKSLKLLQEQVVWLSCSVDRLEMRSRRKILLLHGVPEDKNENIAAILTQLATEKLKITDFSTDELSRCNRMGKPSSSKPRPILFKLREITVRRKIWMAKSKLKGTGFTLTEFMTKSRHDLFKSVRRQFGVHHSWTLDGEIFVLGHDGSKHRISGIDDLNNITPPQTSSVSVSAPKETLAPRTRRAAVSKK